MKSISRKNVVLLCDTYIAMAMDCNVGCDAGGVKKELGQMLHLRLGMGASAGVGQVALTSLG